MHIPRIVIGAPASGGAKTTFSCGLMRALKRRGLALQACKCGPDYIDPMFHAQVVAATARNLDLFFAQPKLIRALVADGAACTDITVVEGVMGYYDGIGVSDKASTWELACTLDAPTLLIVAGRGRARSIAAEILGFMRFRADSRIAGVVLNRTSKSMYPRLAELVENETGTKVYGYLPILPASCLLQSRHLGLVMASEVSDLQKKLDVIADVMETSLDLDAIIALAHSAPEFEYDLIDLPESVTQAPVIAVAHDDAFCFTYADTLRLLEALGAKLAYFSPIKDTALPHDASALYLPGGYPELHAREISHNIAMCESLRCAIEDGMPTVAECGGFLYLHDELEADDGSFYKMLGILPGRCFRREKLTRFGYVTLTAKKNGLLADAGMELRAHEFHYWDSQFGGDAFYAHKPQSDRDWECAFQTNTFYAGFPHLYWYSNPECAARFVRAAVRYSKRRA